MYYTQVRESKRFSWRTVRPTLARSRDEAMQKGEAWRTANAKYLFTGTNAELRTVTESRGREYPFFPTT